MPDAVSSDGGVTGNKGQKAPRRLPAINKEWDADKTYKQAVILMSFSDKDFAMENPRDTYDRMLNETGYNQRNGKGCMAEYYRDQSNGLFNLSFDVYGPYKISSVAQPVTNPTSSTRNYGKEQMVEAVNLWFEEYPSLDYTQYDWNGNGKVNQIIFVYAGYCGNQSNSKSYGHIWPNTSSFTTCTAPDGTKVSAYTCSGELWTNDASCGIGTICHEYTHSLGLPDIYPVGSNASLPYSIVDEWDLMDGGNFTNYGWCPPNWSPLEKMLLGWLTPTELTEPVTVKDLKPVSDGGEVYMIRHSNSEYLLLENRQQSGWDAGLPGKGLVVYRVNYSSGTWNNNVVNGTLNKYNYTIVHADNLDYNGWFDLLTERKMAGIPTSQYQNSNHMNSNFLSTSSYPWITDSLETNQELTDMSVPAAVMLTTNAEGSTLLGKPITDIQMSENGLITFKFMGGDEATDIIKTVSAKDQDGDTGIYDLQGRRLQSAASCSTVYLIRKQDGTVRKVFK